MALPNTCTSHSVLLSVSALAQDLHTETARLFVCCREHLAEAQKRANIDQEAASELFKRWASSKVSRPVPPADDQQASADSEAFRLATCCLAQLLQVNSKLQA